MNFELHQASTRLKDLRRSLLASYDDEDLHQLRVTLRRMRSVLRDTRAGKAGNKTRKLRRKLGALAGATNSARDWDTLRANALEQLGPGQFSALQPLLDKARTKALGQAYDMLQSKEWHNSIRRWKKYLRKNPLETDGPATAPGELDECLQRAAVAGRKAIARDKDRSWHKLRIAIKELRYTLDRLGNSLPEAATAGLLDECKSLQTLLGDWHDTVVHRQLLLELVEQHALAPGTPTGNAANELQRILASRGQQALAQIKHKLLTNPPIRYRDGYKDGCCSSGCPQ